MTTVHKKTIIVEFLITGMFVFVVLLSGCKLPVVEKPKFIGACTIEKADGRVTAVSIEMKNDMNSSITFNINDREAIDQMIVGMESLLLDIKATRDQMIVKEPEPQPPPRASLVKP